MSRGIGARWLVVLACIVLAAGLAGSVRGAEKKASTAPAAETKPAPEAEKHAKTE